MTDQTQNSLAAIENLRADVEAIASKLQNELARHKARIAELGTKDAQQKYSPAFLRSQIETERKRAREVAAQHAESLSAVKARIEAAAKNWSTSSKLREARLVEGDSVEHQILGELRHARLAQEFRDATPAQLVEHIRDAGQHSDLARLELLRKEIARRPVKSEAEKIPLSLAFDEAIAGVKIDGQEQALAVIEAAAEQFSVADDCASELRTGKEAIGTQMRRAVEKHFGTGEQTS